MKLPAVMEKQSTKDETLVVRPLFYCCLYLKKNPFAFCEFFFKTLSDKAMPRCLCLLLMSFDCLFSSSTSPDYFTLLKKDGMSAVFLPLKSSQKPDKGKKRCKLHPTDFLICLSGISPGTGIAGPLTSLRKSVWWGDTSDRDTVTASGWC